MLGNKIKKLREEKNYTQQEFGDKLFHTKSNVSKWENNKVIPDLLTLKKMAVLFDIKLYELLDEENEIQTKKLEKRKQKTEKLKLSWDKTNYSGISNIESSKVARITIHLIGSILSIIGVSLFIPMLIAQDSYTMKTVVLLLIGTLIIIVGITIWIIGIGNINKKAIKYRYNVKFSSYSSYFKLESKISKKSKTFDYSSVRNIRKMTGGISDSVIQLIITVENNSKVTLFDVDESVYEYIRNLKGGGNE